MSKIQEFIDHLKADNVFESMVVIKAALAEKARQAVSELGVEVAEKFGLKSISEEKDEDESDKEDSDKKENPFAKKDDKSDKEDSDEDDDSDKEESDKEDK